jgi:hypothetical protein
LNARLEEILGIKYRRMSEEALREQKLLEDKVSSLEDELYKARFLLNAVREKVESQKKAMKKAKAEEEAKKAEEEARKAKAEKEAEKASLEAREAKATAFKKAKNLYYYGDENMGRWEHEKKQKELREKEVAKQMTALKEALSPLEKELLKYWETKDLDKEDDDSEDRALPTLDYTNGYLEDIQKATKFPFTKSEKHNWFNNYGGSSGVAPRVDDIVDAPQSPFDSKDSEPKNPEKWLEENFDAYYQYLTEERDDDFVPMPDYYGIKTLFITVKNEAEKAKVVEWLKAWKKVGELLNSQNDLSSKLQQEANKKEREESDVKHKAQKIKNKELLLDYLKNKKYTRAEKGSKIYGGKDDTFVYGNLDWITPAVISSHAFDVGDYSIYIREPTHFDDYREEHILISVKEGTSPTPEEAIAYVVSTLEKEFAPAPMATPAPAPAPVRRKIRVHLKKPDAAPNAPDAPKKDDIPSDLAYLSDYIKRMSDKFISEVEPMLGNAIEQRKTDGSSRELDDRIRALRIAVKISRDRYDAEKDAAKKPEAPISIPKKEFVAEHKELVQVLKKDEPKEVAKEAKKQETELKTTLKKPIEKHTIKEIAEMIRIHLAKKGKRAALSGLNKTQLLAAYKQLVG